ncbi:hypothetical protein [Bradyrhizobium sp. RT3a]|uniref:hypothetical protein n=1 Tax=unclassified Bradyrhizobium TaxID=2631580 RepID=UPI0033909EE1
MRRILTGERVGVTERDVGLFTLNTIAVGHRMTNVPIVLPSHDRVDAMSAFERAGGQTNREKLGRNFLELREQAHETMRAEEDMRLRENCKPTEEELYMGAFVEWLEPQVRSAVIEMNRKGYATQSSGFHGADCAIQTIDGLFTIDQETKGVLQQMGVDVWRGAEIGTPKNKLVTLLRFRAKDASIDRIKDRWDAVAAVLPKKTFPAGIRPICDRAEIFREEYAPDHPSLETARVRYFDYLTTAAKV